MNKHRIVVFRKHDDICEFSSEIVWGEHAAANHQGRIPGRIGELVIGYLGGEPTGAEVFGSDIVALSRDHRMVEVWRNPSSFNAEKLNGRVINGYRYRWRASIADVLAEEGDAS